jgi:hypothetical protein
MADLRCFHCAQAIGSDARQHYALRRYALRRSTNRLTPIGGSPASRMSEADRPSTVDAPVESVYTREQARYRIRVVNALDQLSCQL